MTMECITLVGKILGLSWRPITSFSASILFCAAAHAASSAPTIAESSLSKVCAVTVPTSIERATAPYLLPITAMGGDAKSLCGLWHEIDYSNAESILFWKAIVGAVLLHAMAQKKSVAAHQAAIASAIELDSRRKINTLSLAMASVYTNVRENAALGGGWTAKDLVYKIQDRAPTVAVTLRKAYDKWEPSD